MVVRLTRHALLWLVLLAVQVPAHALEVEVQALFRDAALLTVDGQQKMLRAGQSLAGVTLVEADATRAVLDINGQRRELGVHQRIGTNFRAAEARTVTITRNGAMQYLTGALINGRSAQVIVDTGANVVAMNQAHAVAMGIDTAQARPVLVETAGGQVRGWQVMLESVDVGGIRVDRVPATVIEGDSPAQVLLGMSWLQHVDIRETAGVLTLSRDY